MAVDVQAHIRAEEDYWGTSSFRWTSLTKLVYNFHFVAHANESNMGEANQLPTNHWSLFLTTGEQSSVHIDAVPNMGGQPGMIILENKRYAVTNSGTYVVSMVAPARLTVGDVLSIIIENKRDRYIFHPTMEGCRYWLATLANDLAVNRVIDPQALQTVTTALGYYWPYPTGTVPSPRQIYPGTYFV